MTDEQKLKVIEMQYQAKILEIQYKAEIEIAKLKALQNKNEMLRKERRAKLDKIMENESR